MVTGIVCLPFCPCLQQPRRAVKRRSFAGALYYIAHGLLCVGMITGFACVLLLRQHRADGSLSSLSHWAAVDASDAEEVGRFLLMEAFYRAMPSLLLLSPLITAGTLALFALHIRGSPIVYPWICPTTLGCVSLLHILTALYPLPVLLHEAEQETTAWASTPELGGVWSSACRLNKATVAFVGLGWALVWTVWLLAHCSDRWSAEPHFDLVAQWVVTEEDSHEPLATVGDPCDEAKERRVDDRRPMRRKSRRVAAAPKAMAEEPPEELPQGPVSYHVQKRLVPVSTEPLRVVRSLSDPALLPATLLLLTAFTLLLLSFLSWDLLTWTQGGKGSAPLGGLLGGGDAERRVSVGWTNGTDVSGADPFPAHRWSALHLHSFPHSQTGQGLLAFVLLVLVQGPATALVWFRLTAAGEKEGLFQLSTQRSPPVQAAALVAVEAVANAPPLLLLWRAYEGLSAEWQLQRREDLSLGWSGYALSASLCCRAVAVAVFTVRIAAQLQRWREKRQRGETEEETAKAVKEEEQEEETAGSSESDDDDESDGSSRPRFKARPPISPTALRSAGCADAADGD